MSSSGGPARLVLRRADPCKRDGAEGGLFRRRRNFSDGCRCKLRFGNSVERGDTGGRSGIRTHGTLSRTHAFQACALNRSAILPAQGAEPSRGVGGDQEGAGERSTHAGGVGFRPGAKQGSASFCKKKQKLLRLGARFVGKPTPDRKVFWCFFFKKEPLSSCRSKRPSSARPGTPIAGFRPCRTAASASYLPSACPAASACG